MLNSGVDTSPPRNVDDRAQPATTESESNDVARTRRPSIEERLASNMFSYSRQIICLCVAITLTLGFAAIHSAPPRISKPPQARPFFNQSSVVLDFYKGHLDAMMKRTTDVDLSFVMYYAPWDAESQAVRHEFEKVARFYYSKIFFAAINCWHPGSECRAQYTKIQSYPILVLYPSRDSVIEYRGINTAPYIIRFLNNFLRLVTRVTTREDVAQLLVQSDAVVVGFIDFKGISVSPGYKEFYKAATRYLQLNTNGDVTFAIVTDRQTAAKEFGIFSFPSMIVSMWNETLIYPKDSWTSNNLFYWIDSSIHKVAVWLQPPAIKGSNFIPYKREGPALFLLTPRNPLHYSNYNYNLLRQVALQYYSCGDILLTENLVERLEDNIREGFSRHREASKKCIEIVNETNHRPITPVASVSVQQWINDSCCANIFMNKCLVCKNTMDLNSEADVCGVSSDDLREICKESDIFRTSQNWDDYENQQQFCCEGHERWNKRFHDKSPDSTSYESSIPRNENDPRSSTSIMKTFIEDRCALLLAGNKYHYPIFPHDDDSKDAKDVKVTASACKRNKTLTMIAIDSIQYFHFAESLGIDIFKARDKTAVVILDADRESQYLMKRALSRESLIEFINDFTNGLLQRNLRSESSKRFARDFKSSKGCENVKDTEICIQELTTDTFSKVVMDPKMDVVVMYHSPYCAFCSALSYAYLTVAKYLSKMDHLIFVRIDGDNNDLPWEYSMDRYPSILFFPAKRKEDSTVYPYSLPVTIPNLLNFVLANLEGDSHVEALVNICSLGSGEPPKDCVARTRRLCLDIIEKLLTSYRKLSRYREETFAKSTIGNVRREILLKLKHIREIHLILSTVDNLGNDEKHLEIIRRRFKIYYKNLVNLVERHDAKQNKIKNKVKRLDLDKAEEKKFKDEL